jgi:hypothetical protein
MKFFLIAVASALQSLREIVMKTSKCEVDGEMSRQVSDQRITYCVDYVLGGEKCLRNVPQLMAADQKLATISQIDHAWQRTAAHY